jgi:primase-polymerase (primpol)-like protein
MRRRDCRSPHRVSRTALFDFDDVRDSDSGAVPQEVLSVIDRLNGFTEISQSGTGLHTYLRGSLPDGKPTFSAPLAGPGRIEMYDHSRFIGGTWQQATGMPTQAPVAADAITDVTELYEVTEQVMATTQPKGRQENSRKLVSGNLAKSESRSPTDELGFTRGDFRAELGEIDDPTLAREQRRDTRRTTSRNKCLGPNCKLRWPARTKTSP